MYKKIKVDIKKADRQYSIHIDSQIYTALKRFIEEKYDHKKLIIITDDTVKQAYGETLRQTFSDFNPCLLSILPGEVSKSRESKACLEDQLLAMQYGRDSLIIGFGGGVVGDLAGFLASTYMRGIPVIQVPTTLLAMVDSSVGGKTAINTRFGKNLLGTFWQPAGVFVGLDCLKTLPQKEYLNGLAEALKIATILDRELFEFIEQKVAQIMARDRAVMARIVTRCIELKRIVVQADEEEAGYRQILNFGHTIGHALEAVNNFRDKHGFSISRGMAAETHLATLINDLKPAEAQRFIYLQKELNLPTQLDRTYDYDQLIGCMRSDKKAVNKIPRFVLLDGLGKVKKTGNTYSFTCENRLIKQALAAIDTKKEQV